MQCPRCQEDNPPRAKFCLECAAPLGLRCAHCGSPLPGAAKFCPECAQPVAPSATPQPRFASPETYTPAYLAERILTSRTALEGERKQVTVLFADLKGSMELLAGRDPEEARTLLDPVLERMMGAVHRYEGTVNQVMGDGIMALFGAPLAHEDHAVRACYAALRMQESVRRYAEDVMHSKGVPIQIRVGLNSGDVVVRSIGSDLHMDYTAVGQTTHMAARMEQLAIPGSILVTPDVMRLAEGYVQVVSLGLFPVKGLEAPIEVHELLGAGSIRSRLQASAARGLTHFVGREAELAKIREALEKAATGHGQVLAVVGEPGMGKSRLFWEFTRSPHVQGWFVLESASVSYGKATSYLPIVSLLKAYFQIEDRDDPRKIREKVTGKLLTREEAGERTVSPILTLLDLPTDDPRWEALEPPQRRQLTLEALKRLLLRESQVQPLMLVLEDLHWIDSETQGLLDSLVESIPAARILMLVNYRPQYGHTWGSKTYYTQLGIDPLTPERAEQLLRVLLGAEAGLAPLKRLLIDRTEGNPFFVEESVRALVETGVLSGTRGSYRLAKPLEAIQVPPTVQAVLAARIDRLPTDEKRLLQEASVIGKDIPFVLLQASAELPEDVLRRSLTHLQAAELLYEARLFPELEYTFKHALTHEVAYGSLLHERRRALHGRLVDTIEALYPDRLGEHLDKLAHHAVRGQVWDKALLYCRQAGTKALERSAYREAVVHFEQALVALSHLPEGDETRVQAIQMRFALRNSFIPLGEIGRILDHLREAEALAERLGDRRRLGRVMAYMSNHFWWVGDPDRALDYGQRALTMASEAGDVALHVFVTLCLGQIQHALGAYRPALDLLGQNLQVLQGDLLRAQLRAMVAQVLSRSWYVTCLAELGDFAEAVPLAEEGVRMAEATEHPYSHIAAYIGLGYLYVRKGEFDKAIAALERGLDLCVHGDLPTDFVMTASILGYAYLMSGRAGEAVPLLERVVTQAVSIRLMYLHGLFVGWLSEASLVAGRREAAIELGRRALELCRRHRERGNEAYALRSLGAIAAAGDPPDVQDAEDHYRRALDLARDLGMRPLQGECHLGLGRLYRRVGRRPEAAEHLATASELFRTMDMASWLDRARSEQSGLPPAP